MSEETQPSPLQESPKKEEPDKSTEKKTPAYVPPATRAKRQRSVVHYIAILFAAAFLLLLITYLMDRRQNEAVVDSLNQSVTGLRESLSNMQSAQDIYEKNMDLIQQVDDLETQLEEAQAKSNSLSAQLDQKDKESQAMDWFWQIDEAYVLKRYTLCRSLIQSMETAGLTQYLPQESITDNGRFSPADRYQEICSALN